MLATTGHGEASRRCSRSSCHSTLAPDYSFKMCENCRAYGRAMQLKYKKRKVAERGRLLAPPADPTLRRCSRAGCQSIIGHHSPYKTCHSCRFPDSEFSCGIYMPSKLDEQTLLTSIEPIRQPLASKKTRTNNKVVISSNSMTDPRPTKKPRLSEDTVIARKNQASNSTPSKICQEYQRSSDMFDHLSTLRPSKKSALRSYHGYFSIVAHPDVSPMERIQRVKKTLKESGILCSSSARSYKSLESGSSRRSYDCRCSGKSKCTGVVRIYALNDKSHKYFPGQQVHVKIVHT
ncbi:hypothetical protein DL96DRAFT_1634782 [Flagelloscypha sp. PMI_526]|nr:hypothetical protein DL96DRAFT_1634782 [Flagelloscypha sp. PMI_526]